MDQVFVRVMAGLQQVFADVRATEATENFHLQEGSLSEHPSAFLLGQLAQRQQNF